MLTRELMKTHVITIAPDATLSQGIDLMDIYQVDALPVVSSDGQLCGILSEQDVFRAVQELATSEEPTGKVATHNLHRAGSAGQVTVGRVMVTPANFVLETDLLEDAADTMVKLGVNRLPVLSAEGKLIGTLNRIDLLQAVFEGVFAP